MIFNTLINEDLRKIDQHQPAKLGISTKIARSQVAIFTDHWYPSQLFKITWVIWPTMNFFSLGIQMVPSLGIQMVTLGEKPPVTTYFIPSSVDQNRSINNSCYTKSRTHVKKWLFQILIYSKCDILIKSRCDIPWYTPKTKHIGFIQPCLLQTPGVNK